MTRGERKLTDPNEGLLRRVYRTPKRRYEPVQDQITGRMRAPAAAFEPRFPDPAKPDKIVDEAISINVESLLVADNLPQTWGADLKKSYIARFTLADCLANELEAWHAPIRAPKQPENPYHGLVWDLVAMHAADPKKYENVLDVLARASTIVGA